MLRWHTMVLYCNNTQSFHRRILFEPRLHIYVPARLMSFEEIFHACAFIFGANRYNSRVWKRWTHSDMFLSLNRCEHNICRSTVHNITLWMIHSCSLCRNLLAKPCHTHIFWLNDFFDKRHKRMPLLESIV